MLAFTADEAWEFIPARIRHFRAYGRLDTHNLRSLGS